MEEGGGVTKTNPFNLGLMEPIGSKKGGGAKGQEHAGVQQTQYTWLQDAY